MGPNLAPFAKPSVYDCYLRIAVVHCVVFAGPPTNPMRRGVWAARAATKWAEPLSRPPAA